MHIPGVGGGVGGGIGVGGVVGAKDRGGVSSVWNHARICSRPGPANTPVHGYGMQLPLQRQVRGPPLQVPLVAVQ